jgi:hypothetical protein
LPSFRIAGAKINIIYDKTNIEGEKVCCDGVFIEKACWKLTNKQGQQMEERSFSFTPFGFRRKMLGNSWKRPWKSI